LVPGAGCPRRDSNAHCRSPRDRDSCRFGLRGHGAATRCRTGPPALRGPGRKPCAAAKLAILASNQETPGPGPGGSANSPNGH